METAERTAFDRRCAGMRCKPGARLRSEGNPRIVLTPIRAPDANGFCERWVGTVRAECLDWTLIFGRRHLERTLRTYIDHYNEARPHRGLALKTPIGNPSPAVGD